MIKVFFIAKMKSPMPSEYLQMSKKMRELATAHPGFIDITSEEHGDIEITISSWRSKEDVTDWANNPEHMKAKQRSKEWYEWVRGIHVEAVDEKR